MGRQQYGFIGGRSGFYGDGTLSFCAPIDVLTTGEKTPLAKPFNLGDVILDVLLHKHVGETTSGTKTVDVGLSGTAPDDDPDGFLDGVDTEIAGVTRGTLLSTDTLGALLKRDTDGNSIFVPEPHTITKTDALLTYTLGAAHTELVADIYVRLWRPQVSG